MRSLLVKVVAALVVALAVSPVVTALVASRLTRGALDGQAERNAMSHLSVLQEAYADRERDLVVYTRNLAQTLISRGLLDVSRRPELIAELGRAGNNLEFDILCVLDAAGRDLPTPVGVGATLASPSGAPEERVSLEPASRLLRTMEGGFVQAVPVALGSGPERLLLLAGHKFQDPFAYQLRKQIGSLDHIVLVAAGRWPGRRFRSSRPRRRPRIARRWPSPGSRGSSTSAGRGASSPTRPSAGRWIARPSVSSSPIPRPPSTAPCHRHGWCPHCSRPLSPSVWDGCCSGPSSARS